MVFLIIWFLMGCYMIYINQEELDQLVAWRSIVCAVILGIFAPVFFAVDFLEIVLGYLGMKEEEDEDENDN